MFSSVEFDACLRMIVLVVFYVVVDEVHVLIERTMQRLVRLWAGTASEVRLALRYGRPIVAWLRGPEELPDLAPGVGVVASLGEVERFLVASLPALG